MFVESKSIDARKQKMRWRFDFVNGMYLSIYKFILRIYLLRIRQTTKTKKNII